VLYANNACVHSASTYVERAIAWLTVPLTGLTGSSAGFSSIWIDMMRHALLTRRQIGATLASIGMLTSLPRVGRADTILRVGDQKGGAKALMTAAGVLDGISQHLEWNVFAAAAPLLEALNANAIDCGGVGDAPFAFARAAGVKAKIVVGTRSSGASTALLVPAASQARSFADLKGRTIATGKGSVGHYLVLAARQQAGLQPGDIKIAFLSPADAQSAFTAGAVDAWSTWGPYVWLAARNKARILVDGKGLMSGLSYYIASERAIADKRDLLLDYNKRLVTALRWGLEHRDAYAAAWSAETGVPVDVARQTLVAQSYTPAPIDAQMIADQQRVIDLYVQEGLLPAHYDAATGFETSFNV
jgi:sulfonate transport system substrate-binding protein